MKVALALHRIGLRGSLMHGLGIGSILAAISLWGRSATVSETDRKARAERFAIFVGLWPRAAGHGGNPGRTGLAGS
jgi:hypothetical protein